MEMYRLLKRVLWMMPQSDSTLTICLTFATQVDYFLKKSQEFYKGSCSTVGVFLEKKRRRRKIMTVRIKQS